VSFRCRNLDLYSWRNWRGWTISDRFRRMVRLKIVSENDYIDRGRLERHRDERETVETTCCFTWVKTSELSFFVTFTTGYPACSVHGPITVCTFALLKLGRFNSNSAFSNAFHRCSGFTTLCLQHEPAEIVFHVNVYNGYNTIPHKNKIPKLYTFPCEMTLTLSGCNPHGHFFVFNIRQANQNVVVKCVFFCLNLFVGCSRVRSQ